MKKLSKLASLLAMTFVGVCLVACQPPTTENSNGLATLPGTAGGSTNAKDIFQGKTFYNNAEEPKAYEKYVFGTDGTCTYYGKDRSYSDEELVAQGEWVARSETKYSLSSDGNTMYQVLNRTVASSTDSELHTYQELLNDESAKKDMKEGWDKMSEEVKNEVLSEYGLPSTATFEQFYQASFKSLFSVILEYEITSDAEGNDGKPCIKLTRKPTDESEDYSIFLYSTNTN